MADHSRLGRGLAALMGDVGEETHGGRAAARKPRRVPIENLSANPRNPRRAFSEAELNELADSIRERGIIQPIVVRAGARRGRRISRSSPASGAGARRSAPACTRCRSSWSRRPTRRRSNSPSSRTCSAPISIAIEEATGYQALMDEFNHSQDDIAQIVGKSRTHVANTLRLLKLSEPVQALVHSGKLSAGHARMLVGQPNALELARRHRQARAERAPGRGDDAQGRRARRRARSPAPSRGKDADTKALERRLSDALGLEVAVDHRADGGGTLHIKYRDLDQLDAVLRKLDRK